MLSDTSMTSTDVPALLPILPQTCSGRAPHKGTASDTHLLEHEQYHLDRRLPAALRHMASDHRSVIINGYNITGGA